VHRGRRGGIGFVAGLLCVLALAGPASGAARESAFVERATTAYRATVGCYGTRDWAALVDAGYPDLKGDEADVYGFWRYDPREVALPARGCNVLERWRSARTRVLGTWIFVLGHELTHVQQTDFHNAPWSRPFDEAQADCGGYAKFESVRLALGIRRAVTAPARSLTRCPMRRARHR
jgi:hypothetical protein